MPISYRDPLLVKLRQAGWWCGALLAVAGFLGQIAGLSVSALDTSDTTWSEFHRPDMARWNPYEHILNADNVGRLMKKWHYATPGGNFSSPAVVNGTLYFGSEDYSVYALDAATGAAIWTYPTGFYVHSSPAVAKGLLYIGSENWKVYGLNAHTGARLWSYRTGGGIWSSPVVANGVVYVGSSDKNLYALDARTGSKLGVIRPAVSHCPPQQ